MGNSVDRLSTAGEIDVQEPVVYRLVTMESLMNETQTTPSREKVNHDQTALGFNVHDVLELGIAIFSVTSASAGIFLTN